MTVWFVKVTVTPQNIRLPTESVLERRTGKNWISDVFDTSFAGGCRRAAGLGPGERGQLGRSHVASVPKNQLPAPLKLR